MKKIVFIFIVVAGFVFAEENSASKFYTGVNLDYAQQGREGDNDGDGVSLHGSGYSLEGGYFLQDDIRLIANYGVSTIQDFADKDARDVTILSFGADYIIKNAYVGASLSQVSIDGVGEYKLSEYDSGMYMHFRFGILLQLPNNLHLDIGANHALTGENKQTKEDDGSATTDGSKVHQAQTTLRFGIAYRF